MEIPSGEWPITYTLYVYSLNVVETSVTNNSSFHNYPHPYDHTIRTTDTPGTNHLLSLNPF